MHRTTYTRRRIVAGLAVAGGLFAHTAAAQQPMPDPKKPADPAPPAAAAAAPQAPAIGEARVDKITNAVIVPTGGTVRFTPPGNRLITDVFVKNEDTVNARLDPAAPTTLVLTGLAPGVTDLTLTFRDGTRTLFQISVEFDYQQLENVIRRAVPTASVKVIPGVGQVIILSGFVIKPEDSDTIVRIASGAVRGNVNNIVNALQIGGDTHVLIDTCVAQVDRTELRERGTSFGVQGTQAGFSSVLGGLATSNAVTNVFGASGAGGGGLGAPLTTGAAANLQLGIVPPGFVTALRALSTEGVAKFLSEPKVVTQTGRPAILRAGGQQATLGPAAGINGPGVVLYDVGTTVEVLPIVLGTGKIYLEVAPLFRTVNAGRGVTTAFGFTPGFNETSIRSSVLMESGQTYAIGGLIESQSQTTAERVPYLGSLPVVGFAFSSVRSDERETELVILVTPRLVDALDCNQLPKRVPGRETRAPDDYELFLESLIEAPRGQRRVFNGHRYVPAYKNDPSAGAYPCANGTGGPNCAAPAAAVVPAAVAPVVPAPAADPAPQAPVPQ